MFSRVTTVLLSVGLATSLIIPTANGSVWDTFKKIKLGEPQPAESEAAAPTTATPQPASKKAGQNTGNQTGSAADSAQASRKITAIPGAGASSGSDRSLTTAPQKPTETGNWWAWYRGKMHIAGNDFYDPHGIDFEWAYGRKNPLPDNPRIVVHMHGSGGGKGAIKWAFAPSRNGDIEVRVQDAETYSQDWREWWAFGRDGAPYPGRRIVAALDFVSERYAIDASQRGIVLEGPSMGGVGAVLQTMILPDPWRAKIALSAARIGAISPRRIAQKSPGQYATLPPDDGSNNALWDSIDFSLQARKDPIVRGIHYRHVFSTNDQFAEGPEGSIATEFVNMIEQNAIGGAFTWVKAGHDSVEPGVKLPDLSQFETKEQDITLDRAHPVFTRSTGNYPFRPQDRINEKKYPRGHYNMGLLWNHAKIVDTNAELVFPLKYHRRTGIGKDIPDQALRITVDVTPRRPRNFALVDGQILQWEWNKGELSGSATVKGDRLTIKNLPLVHGQPYKNLRIFR